MSIGGAGKAPALLHPVQIVEAALTARLAYGGLASKFSLFLCYFTACFLLDRNPSSRNYRYEVV